MEKQTIRGIVLDPPKIYHLGIDQSLEDFNVCYFCNSETEATRGDYHNSRFCHRCNTLWFKKISRFYEK